MTQEKSDLNPHGHLRGQREELRQREGGNHARPQQLRRHQHTQQRTGHQRRNPDVLHRTRTRWVDVKSIHCIGV